MSGISRRLKWAQYYIANRITDYETKCIHMQFTRNKKPMIPISNWITQFWTKDLGGWNLLGLDIDICYSLRTHNKHGKQKFIVYFQSDQGLQGCILYESIVLLTCSMHSWVLLYDLEPTISNTRNSHRKLILYDVYSGKLYCTELVNTIIKLKAPTKRFRRIRG